MPAIVSSGRLRLCSGLSVTVATVAAAAATTAEPCPGNRLLGKSKMWRLFTGHLPFRTASQMCWESPSVRGPAAPPVTAPTPGNGEQGD
ncbi:hypothetical protein EYF80_029395 [Liparis tanakae]|uniref:Secreted protein n=1 Tax=Liparis tanakae TaxID=230148 RepID=A0A4Z2H3L6_9TELE|nr:hypothetical protein EYF80_029395 [Liparis tanakae]